MIDVAALFALLFALLFPTPAPAATTAEGAPPAPAVGAPAPAPVLSYPLDAGDEPDQLPPGEPAPAPESVQEQLPEEVCGRQLDGPDGEVFVVTIDANGEPCP